MLDSHANYHHNNALRSLDRFQNRRMKHKKRVRKMLIASFRARPDKVLNPDNTTQESDTGCTGEGVV